MIATVRPSFINGTITPPSSKSEAHRAMIAALLSEGQIFVQGRLEGEDVEATMRAIEVLGAEVERTNSGLKITSGAEYRDKAIKSGLLTIDCGESGSTLRFILPVICALGATVRLTGKGRLSQRPLGGLLDALKDGGAKIKGDRLPLTAGGRLRGGVYKIPADVSSQYITGMLLALPLTGEKCLIALEGDVVSAPYVDITRNLLKKFGIESRAVSGRTVKEEWGIASDGGFVIDEGQTYKSPDIIAADADWSSAGFWAVAGAVAGRITLASMNADSTQGDKVVLDILKRAGADVKITDGKISVCATDKLKAFSYDCSDCPDTVPVLSVLAAASDGVSVISDADRLRDKESDRLSAVMSMLDEMGIISEYKDGSLYIRGGRIKSGSFDGFGDHRMAMSAIVAALAADGESTVEGTECIAKSYPSFIEDLRRLGGNVTEDKNESGV